MITVRLVTFVFLDKDDLWGFVLFVLVLFGLFLMAVLSIMSPVMEERVIVMMMERLFLAVRVLIVGISMAMGITQIVVVCVILGVSVVRQRSLVRMNNMHPRFAHVTLKRVGPRSVAIGTVLTRLLILFCTRKINAPARR